MASRIAALALVLSALPACAAHAALEGPVRVLAAADAGRPDVLLRSDGTAVVVWETATNVRVCRLPVGAEACASQTTLTSAAGATRSRPFVLALSGGRVGVVQGVCCPQATYRWLSNDGGASFGARVDFASVVPADEGVAAGPGDGISLLGAPARYQLAASSGNTKTTQELALDTDTEIAASRAVAIDPATGRPFASWGTPAGAEAAGAVTPVPTAEGSWTSPTPLAGATGVRLSGGWATWVRDGRHEVARWTGSAFADAVALPYAATDTGEADVVADASGNLHVVWSPAGSGRVCYAQAPGDGTFTAPVLLGGDSDGVAGLQVAATGPSAGLVVFTRPSGGPVSALALSSSTLRPNICGVAPSGLGLSITPGGAQARVTLDGNGQESTWRVELGPTTEYGAATPEFSVPGGVSTATTLLPALEPGTTYHARLVATNATGTAVSTDITFTTPARVPAAREVIAFPGGCASGRLTVRLGSEAFPARRALVRVAGRRARRLGPKALAAGPVELEGLPRGGVRVRVIVRLANGRIVAAARRFASC